MKKIIVNKNAVRLDAYIADNIEDMSRVKVQRLLDKENILVNGNVKKAAYKVNVGDQITIEEEKVEELSLKAQEIPIEIIYEDDDIIVVNKPKGIVVHPANGNPDGTLVNAILGICKESLSGIGGKIRPGIVHRIDKDTSGILIVAKNDKAHIHLSEQIKNHEIEKTYIALVRGIIKDNKATINMPIGRSKSNRKKMAVREDGKNAITHFEVLKRYESTSLLDIKIETGRTHQIRVHFAQIGFPIIGDKIYSNGRNEWNIEGQTLHAKSLKFTHPITLKEMYLEANLPTYFEEVLKDLESRENNGK